MNLRGGSRNRARGKFWPPTPTLRVIAAARAAAAAASPTEHGSDALRGLACELFRAKGIQTALDANAHVRTRHAVAAQTHV